MNFKALFEQSDLSIDEVAARHYVSTRTIRSWLKYDCKDFLKYQMKLITGNAPGWSGFQIKDGYIITPDGQTITKGELCNYHYQRQLMKNALDHAKRQSKDLQRYENASSSANESHIKNIYSEL